VQRQGSLARAARELGVTKATASRRLAALEEALGAKLVERRPSGLELTPAGRQAIAAAEGVEAALAGLADRVSAAADVRPAGLVRVTVPPWIADRFLIPALPELTARYSELQVDLDGTNKILNLAQREADVAIRNARPTQRSLIVRKVARLGGCVYGSRLYLEGRGTPRSRKEVVGHDVLAYETLGGMPGF
jgi:molybdate transport repressor ModE-like protein